MPKKHEGHDMKTEIKEPKTICAFGFSFLKTYLDSFIKTHYTTRWEGCTLWNAQKFQRCSLYHTLLNNIYLNVYKNNN
jgi:hypothetical protein